MTPLLKYTVLQLPGLAFVALLGLLLWRFAELPGWAAAGAVMLWAVKDAAFYPFVRQAYAGAGASATARLVGQCGVARQMLAPRGYVALGSELWRAEVEPGAAPIAAGHAVRVVGARRLTLIVAPTDEP
jgi:membrane protein implicated in regulation of membrane protease activity